MLQYYLRLSSANWSSNNFLQDITKVGLLENMFRASRNTADFFSLSK